MTHIKCILGCRVRDSTVDCGSVVALCLFVESIPVEAKMHFLIEL